MALRHRFYAPSEEQAGAQRLGEDQPRRGGEPLELLALLAARAAPAHQQGEQRADHGDEEEPHAERLEAASGPGFSAFATSASG